MCCVARGRQAGRQADGKTDRQKGTSRQILTQIGSGGVNCACVRHRYTSPAHAWSARARPQFTHAPAHSVPPPGLPQQAMSGTGLSAISLEGKIPNYFQT